MRKTVEEKWYGWVDGFFGPKSVSGTIKRVVEVPDDTQKPSRGSRTDYVQSWEEWLLSLHHTYTNVEVSEEERGRALKKFRGVTVVAYANGTYLSYRRRPTGESDDLKGCNAPNNKTGKCIRFRSTNDAMIYPSDVDLAKFQISNQSKMGIVDLRDPKRINVCKGCQICEGGHVIWELPNDSK